MKREKEAIYIGDHKIGYRAERNEERGILYRKNGEEIFKPCMQFMQDLLTGPCIKVTKE